MRAGGDAAYDASVRAAALEIIAEERATRASEVDYQPSGSTAETSSSFASFDDDGVSTTTLSDEDRAHAKILMRDLPRVLRELEAGVGVGRRGVRGADERLLAAATRRRRRELNLGGVDARGDVDI